MLIKSFFKNVLVKTTLLYDILSNYIFVVRLRQPKNEPIFLCNYFITISLTYNFTSGNVLCISHLCLSILCKFKRQILRGLFMYWHIQKFTSQMYICQRFYRHSITPECPIILTLRVQNIILCNSLCAPI